MQTELRSNHIHCEGCAGTIRRRLSAIPGVAEVRVDPGAKLVVVRHDDSIARHQLADAMAEVGYPETDGQASALVMAAPAGTHIDPVCGMPVDPATAAGSVEHDGATYWFCSTSCVRKFRTDPDQYLNPREAEAMPPADLSAIYICPMHPEVRQQGPGTCPLCGMALEPETVSAEVGDDPELIDMRRRLWIAVVLAVPLLALAMLPMAGIPIDRWLGHEWSIRLQFALATPIVLFAGAPFFVRAVQSVRHCSPNMFTLIALGTGAAYGYSVFATLFPQTIPESLTMHGVAEVYFEAAGVIITLVLLGQVLELRARHRTSAALRELLSLAPPIARRIQGDRDVETPVADLCVGDRLRVLPGDKVPLDGEIVEGRSAVDESMISGEAIPLEKGPGDRAIAGTQNQHGAFVMRVTHVGQDTMLAQIVQMVSQAQRSRVPIQRLADQVASVFVPAVLTVAVLTWIAWAIWGPEGRALSYAFANAVAVLIIACPCALGLATPMSIMVGIGRGASLGVLFKNAEALETLRQIDTLVIDKTGTLTEGRPSVAQTMTAEGVSETELLRIASAVERNSEHPLARAIVRAAEERSIPAPATNDFHAYPGGGVRATLEGAVIAIGSPAFLQSEHIASFDEALTASLIGQGRTVVHVAKDRRWIGSIALADRIKQTTPAALDWLRRQNVHVVMLTGDDVRTAEAVAKQLGIREYRGRVSPAQKHEEVQRLKSQGRRVAMTGDGINDAPALAAADVGIAMGMGTDVAIESAGVTLVRGDLRGIERAIELSRAIVKNIRQNLFFAFVYNLLGVPIAAGVLYPMFGVLLNPMIASAAMSLSSVSVIANALRLRAASKG
ncbi:MAG: heavy metal translocating P-type ATPase [Gemmataceae bacterium]